MNCSINYAILTNKFLFDALNIICANLHLCNTSQTSNNLPFFRSQKYNAKYYLNAIRFCNKL